MLWYYTSEGQRQGPISDSSMQNLFTTRVISEDTLVWCEGMNDWKPLKDSDLATRLQLATDDGDPWETCAYSGERGKRSTMVELDGFLVSADHKDRAVEYLQEGGNLPRIPQEGTFTGNIDFAHLMQETWRLLQPCLGNAIALYFLVTLPLNLIASYADRTHFGDEHAMQSIHFYNILNMMLGNIFSGGLLFMISHRARSLTSTFSESLRAGFSNWGRLWVADFISGLLLIMGIILLIIPGIIVAVRTSFAHAAAVERQLRGSAAVQESFDVTRGFFWPVLTRMMVISILCSLPSIIFSSAQDYVPYLQQWGVEGVMTTALELPWIFLGTFAYCFYRELHALHLRHQRRL